MQILWRTLLLIALCVQMPLSAIASYASHAPQDQHHHSLSAEAEAHSAQAADHEESGTSADCSSTHHHCSASHLSLMVQTHWPVPIGSQRDVFDLRAEVFFQIDPLSSIERPKWAII